MSASFDSYLLLYDVINSDEFLDKIMQFIFIFIVIVGSFYFLFVKRNVDFFSIAYFSACIYFLPGFYGYVLIPEFHDRVQQLLLTETYWIMIAVLVFILIGAVIYDYTLSNVILTTSIRGGQYAVDIAVATAITGCLLSVATTGHYLFYFDKVVVLEHLNRWHKLWEISASLGMVLSFSQRRWILFAISLLLLFFDLFIGFRSPLALAMIAVFALWLSGKGKQRLAINSFWICTLGFCSIVFYMIYKSLYAYVKLGDWSTIFNRLFSPSYYIEVISHSEPFITQAVLNQIVKERFLVGLDHFYSLFNNLIFFSSSIGIKETSFNQLFQPELFPYAKGGMANNIWAEMWSSGGWYLLISFIVFFVVCLFLGSLTLKIYDPVLRGILALFLSYLVFYIHRNELGYQITLMRNVIFFGFSFVFLSALLTITKIHNVSASDKILCPGHDH